MYCVVHIVRIESMAESNRVIVKEIHQTINFPEEELYGLSSQMKRAVISIPSNIAEGYRRGLRKECIQFLRAAFGSCSEPETQVSLAYDLKFLSDKDRNTLIDSVDGVEKVLTGLIKA